MSSNHSQENIKNPENLYANLDIGAIIRKYLFIDRDSLIKASGKSEKAVQNQIAGYVKRNQVIIKRKGKYALYIWNHPNNPFIRNPKLLSFDFDEYCARYSRHRRLQKTVKFLSSLHLMNGPAYLLNRFKKSHQSLAELKNQHDDIEKSIDAYIQKMLFNQYNQFKSINPFPYPQNQ
jgi:hypothetical protein